MALRKRVYPERGGGVPSEKGGGVPTLEETMTSIFIRSFWRKMYNKNISLKKIFQSYKSLYTGHISLEILYCSPKPQANIGVLLMIDHKGFVENKCQCWRQGKISSPFKRECPEAFPFFIPLLAPKNMLFPTFSFRLIDPNDQFFTSGTTIGPFAISLSIKILMTFHSYVYFNLGSQSYLQNAVPNM